MQPPTPSASLTGTLPDGVLWGLFVLTGLTLAGCVHVLWMRSTAAQRFAVPLDGGVRVRGRRLLGDNKTWRGFVALVPASGLAFYLLAVGLPLLAENSPRWLWHASPAGYALLGLAGGAGLMLGELPNSFIKRQLDIAPGEAARTPVRFWLFSMMDRFDSVIGALLAISFIAPTPLSAWLVVLIAGPMIHGALSVCLYRLGGKRRAV